MYNEYGYEKSLQMINAVEKGEIIIEVGNELSISNITDFNDKQKWEIIRFIEYMKFLQDEGRDTQRVIVKLSE